MKKYLLILLALTAGMSVSCNKDESTKNKYEFYEPVMTWNASMSEIRTDMGKMADWTESPESEDNKLVYENKKNKSAQMEYQFVGGKMTECSVLYVDCNDKFTQMKDDWAKKLNLSWKDEGTYAGWQIFSAYCESKNCNVQAGKGATGNIGIMSIDFTCSN